MLTHGLTFSIIYNKCIVWILSRQKATELPQANPVSYYTVIWERRLSQTRYQSPSFRARSWFLISKCVWFPDFCRWFPDFWLDFFWFLRKAYEISGVADPSVKCYIKGIVMENIDDTVSWVQRQYFQAVAMKYFDWDSLKSTKSVRQEIILKAVCTDYWSLMWSCLKVSF